MEPSIWPNGHWREMQNADISAVVRVAAVVHPLYPEKDEVFAERLHLYAAGSHVLTNEAGSIVGYIVSHPWPYGAIPMLDSSLGALPQPADCFYIHDIALLPAIRGRRAAQAAVAQLADHAAHSGFARMALVAIAGTQGFWQKQGFAVIDLPSLTAKLASYDLSARYMTRAL